MNNSHFSENLHISTMVQIGKLNTQIILKSLAESLNTNDNILYIEYGSEINKGFNDKKLSKKKLESKKYFYNQLTLHIHNSLKKNKRVNVKIFNNGRIQMTGINSDLVGSTTMEIVLKEFIQLSNKCDIFSDINILQIGDLETVLINSEY